MWTIECSRGFDAETVNVKVEAKMKQLRHQIFLRDGTAPSWKHAVRLAVPGLILGVVVICTLFAAESPTGFEAESGSLAGSASMVTPSGASSGGAVQFGPSRPGYTLTLDDEFNGTSLDTSKWTPYWFGEGDTMNNVATNAANVSVSGGYLNLHLASASSGALISADPSDGVSGHTGYQFTYGYMEARIYLSGSNGTISNWPAFWATSQDWPSTGELDVVEGLGGQAAYHFHYGTSASPQQQGAAVTGDYTRWHTYGANWQPGRIDYYYDGSLVGSVTKGVTDDPQYPVLNIGTGTWGGPVVTPSDMKVDYVRIWQQ